MRDIIPMMAKKQTSRPRGRPPREDADNMDQIAIRLPKALLATIDASVVGRLDGKNRSDMIRESLVEALEAREKRK